ncbi:hypothetical protein OIO90_000896 [Microbotryomycetes sp. JL221]|nr:hypothetical protein OIO90_000896 [Microbotryomycetes sp. JL221]
MSGVPVDAAQDAAVPLAVDTTQPQVAVANAAGVSTGGASDPSTGTARITGSSTDQMQTQAVGGAVSAANARHDNSDNDALVHGKTTVPSLQSDVLALNETNSPSASHQVLNGSADASSLEHGTLSLGSSQAAHTMALAAQSTDLHTATTSAASTTLGRASSLRRLQFPILPASQPSPNQTFQTPTQMASILSLPPSLLMNLARTTSPEQQQAIASRAQAASYLSSMALPPPSPTTVIGAMTAAGTAGSNVPPPKSATSIGDHPAIPILLGQAFSPPVPGIMAPTFDTSKAFVPTYASVEDWSFQAARERVEAERTYGNRHHAAPVQGRATSSTSATGTTASMIGTASPSMPRSRSFNEREIASMAEQLAQWALKEQENQVQEQVITNKETAIMLAAQAAARLTVFRQAATAVTSAPPTEAQTNPNLRMAAAVVQGGPEAGAVVETALSGMDLSPYAETFRKQLDALACGYYAQLHREAIKRIANNAEFSPTIGGSTGEANEKGVFPSPSSAPPSRRGSTDARSRTTTPTLPTSAPTLGLPTPTMEALSDVAGREQAEAMHVQAAAAAAVAANAMAAKEIASMAGTQLQKLGVDVPQLVPRLVPDPPTGGLKSLELPPEAIAVANAAHAQGIVASSQSQRSSTASSNQAGDSVHHELRHQRQQQVQSPPYEVKAFLSHPTAPQLHTPEKRDFLLSYAHTVYTRNPRSQELLPLLHTLEQVHPDHLPTLLLMSCVYYTRGELESSLYYNKKLLARDPHYVEAMSNIGTTLRAMGKWKDAETWWFRAIRLRPTYWDATENLLGVLCNPTTSSSATSTASAKGEEPPPSTPRYQEALALCEFVETQIWAEELNSDATSDSDRYGAPPIKIKKPLMLPASVPHNHVHRLQNLFYAKGNLRMALGDLFGAKDEYEKAVEIVLSFPPWTTRELHGRLDLPLTGLTTRDFVVAAVVVARVLSAHEQYGPSNPAVVKTMQDLGVAEADGRFAARNVFRVVQQGGDEYVKTLLAHGGGFLPTILLRPNSLEQLPHILFGEIGRGLPAVFDAHKLGQVENDPTRVHAQQSTKQTTSTMLLTLAKIVQDAIGTSSNVTLGGIPPSNSLLLPLYYIALALYPSPSTCNNLGILLSTMTATALVQQPPHQQPVLLTGQNLAHMYYEYGLRLDPKHPHLYTNLGSLLKDMGQLPQAVAMYKKAVDFNSTFDVALANLANAVKDMGQIQESIPFYRRAVAINPNFPEAICGLVNALGGVCDWQGRGGVDEDFVVDNENNLVPVSTIAHVNKDSLPRTGYMGQIANLVDKQLQDGVLYGIGSLKQLATVEGWLSIVSHAIHGKEPAAVDQAWLESWKSKLEFVTSDLDSNARIQHGFNEGGFLIRLVERLMRRTQRRWYLDAYSKDSTRRIVATAEDVGRYGRPVLPQSLPVAPVPPWMPVTVYPPPRPPHQGKLNIGYVSSDLGNHPLSHLMQSVFGFHDLDKFNVFCYATSPSDNSAYRLKIEAEAQHFLDVSAASVQQIVEKIVSDEIHILINLSGYTKGARNEVFAARPAPVQMSYMGFAGTLSAGWCDYFIVDPIVCPPELVSGNRWRLESGDGLSGTQSGPEKPTDFEGDPDPESARNDFVYTEKLIYMPHSYFVTDHKQAWKEDPNAFVLPGEVPIRDDGSPETRWAIEEDKRWKMRKAMFPQLADDTIIFANWNQLYKIDPFIFRVWLNILEKLPNSILWLLRFPAPGEAHIRATAHKWAGPTVADRIVFTDVANKADHIHRGRIADLFLDTTECNAHTTAADILWSGTPLLTFPRHKHKMASRVAASIAMATGFGSDMIVSNASDYEKRAVELAQSVSYDLMPAATGVEPTAVDARPQRRGRGELSDLRRKLFLTREDSPLFDTKRWVRNVEQGYLEAWDKWVSGAEFEDLDGAAQRTGCVWVADARDGVNIEQRSAYIK